MTREEVLACWVFRVGLGHKMRTQMYRQSADIITEEVLRR